MTTEAEACWLACRAGSTAGFLENTSGQKQPNPHREGTAVWECWEFGYGSAKYETARDRVAELEALLLTAVEKLEAHDAPRPSDPFPACGIQFPRLTDLINSALSRAAKPAPPPAAEPAPCGYPSCARPPVSGCSLSRDGKRLACCKEHDGNVMRKRPDAPDPAHATSRGADECAGAGHGGCEGCPECQPAAAKDPVIVMVSKEDFRADPETWFRRATEVVRVHVVDGDKTCMVIGGSLGCSSTAATKDEPLSAEDSRRVLDLLENPPPPTEALKRAMARTAKDDPCPRCTHPMRGHDDRGCACCMCTGPAAAKDEPARVRINAEVCGHYYGRDAGHCYSADDVRAGRCRWHRADAPAAPPLDEAPLDEAPEIKAWRALPQVQRTLFIAMTLERIGKCSSDYKAGAEAAVAVLRLLAGKGA